MIIGSGDEWMQLILVAMRRTLASMDDSGNEATVTGQIAGQSSNDGQVKPVMACDETFWMSPMIFSNTSLLLSCDDI